MQTITAVIPAHNEEENIMRCIKSLAWCDKVIVMSTGQDKTAKIAKSLGVQVEVKYTNTVDDFTAVQKNINWAIDTIKTDWILRIDADEVVTRELKDEIQKILNADRTSCVAYGIPRKQYFFGGFLKGGDWAYDRLIRLFRPNAARYEPIVQVHEQFKVTGETGYLTSALEHFSHPTLAIALKKFNCYTSLETKHLRLTFIQAVFKMILNPPYIFLRWMIWHHGYRDGLRGVVAGLFRALYDFLLYAKYIESTYNNHISHTKAVYNTNNEY